MKSILAAIVLAVVLLPGGDLRAAPLAPHAPPIAVPIIPVKDGCGIGFHRLASGVCRPQPKGPRLMRLFARKCALGYRRNALGRCVRE